MTFRRSGYRVGRIAICGSYCGTGTGLVQARTRIMNQLQAVALNEGLRGKKRLWRERGRQQLESFRLAPWASRRRRDLLELLDRLNPTIAELSQAIERQVEKCREAQR